MASQVDFIRGVEERIIQLPASELYAPKTTLYTLCVVHTDTHVVMKYADRGVCEGKWNSPGGKVENGEGKMQSALRETFDETGLIVDPGYMLYNGVLKCGFLKENEVHIVDIFSSKKFDGTLKSTAEGFVNWKKRADLPIEGMWKDKILWFKHVLRGEEFITDVVYSDKTGDKMLRGSTTVVRRAIPAKCHNL